MLACCRRVCLFFVLFAYGLGFAQTSCEHDKHCMMVIDAGSSGSRAYMYQYQLNKQNVPVSIEILSSSAVKPGLSSLKPEQVSDYLQELFVSHNVNKIERVVPTYFYATAGMRLLSSPQQERLYKKVRDYVKENQSTLILKDAKTISGSEEALFAWLAVNHASFNSNSPTSTLPVMDFGGASIEIAFETEASSSLNGYTIKLGNLSYDVYADSFLGLGEGLALNQYLNQGACYANGYPLPNNKKARGALSVCTQSIMSLVNQVHHVKDRVNISKLSQNTSKNWVVLGGMHFISDHKLLQLGEVFTFNELIRKGNNIFCQKSWQELNELAPEDAYLYANCFHISYYQAVITKGYGLPATSIIQTKINGEEPSWTKGVIFKQYATLVSHDLKTKPSAL